MDQLDIIRDWILTDQQLKAYELYVDHVYEYGRHPSRKDFIEFYKMWVYNQKKSNDLSVTQMRSIQ